MKQRVLLIIFGIFIPLFFAELVLRIFIFYIEGSGRSLANRLQSSVLQASTLQANSNNLRGLIKTSDRPDMVYELKPFTSGNFQGQPYQSNSFGIRDREYDLKKAPGTVRIVGVGDSVMFGWGVREEESYLSLVEKEYEYLTSAKAKLEVLNFAIPGYNTAMEIALLENKALLFNPDIIVLHVVNNDLEVPLFMIKPQNVFSLQQSFLQQFLLKNSALPSGLVRAGTSASSDRVLSEYRHLAGIQAFKTALRRLAVISKDRNAEVLIVYGRLPFEMREFLGKISKKRKFRLVPVKEELEQILRENNIAEDPEARAKAIQVSETDSHPNVLGHQAYARALSAALSELPQIREARLK